MRIHIARNAGRHSSAFRYLPPRVQVLSKSSNLHNCYPHTRAPTHEVLWTDRAGAYSFGLGLGYRDAHRLRFRESGFGLRAVETVV